MQINIISLTVIPLIDFLCLFSQMARLNEGLSLFDAILIVPMFQIAWTFFSICTGFIYFKEFQVLSLSQLSLSALSLRVWVSVLFWGCSGGS